MTEKGAGRVPDSGSWLWVWVQGDLGSGRVPDDKKEGMRENAHPPGPP